MALQVSQKRFHSGLSVHPFSLEEYIPRQVHRDKVVSADAKFLDDISIHGYCKRTIEMSALSRLCRNILGKVVMKTLVDVCFYDIKVGIDAILLYIT